MKGLIFTYLMTYGGAVVSLFHPYTGLLIYVGFAILRPEAMWYWSVPAGNYSRVVAIALLIGWAVQGFGRWNFGRGAAALFCLVGFLFWAMLSAPLAQDAGVAFGYVEELVKIVLPCVVGMTMIDSVAKLKQLAWVIVVSQGYVAFEMNMAYFDGFNRAQEIGFGGLDNNGLAIGMVTTVGLAFFLGMGSTVWWQKAIAFISALLMMHVVMFSFSRGGMLALVITGIAAFLLTPKSPKHYLAYAAAVLIGLVLAGNEVRNRFLTVFVEEGERDVSAQSRLDLWNAQLKVIQSNPLFGCGPAHWRLIAENYGFVKGKDGHSLWVQTAAELGLVGVGLLAGFYLVCLLRLWRLTSESTPVPDPWLRDAARMVVASLIGFAVSAQFVSVVGLEVSYYVALIGAAALKLASLPATAPATSVAAPARSRYPQPAW